MRENIGRLFTLPPSPLSLSSSSPPPAMEQRLAMGRKDIFRMRKQNTSRPPSMHVDDFMAIGVRSSLIPRPKDQAQAWKQGYLCYMCNSANVLLQFPSLLSLVPIVPGGEEPWVCRIWPLTMREPSCSSLGGGGWVGCTQEWDSTRGETLLVRNLNLVF